MTTREKVIEIIDRLSEVELEAEYTHLCRVTAHGLTDDEFNEALEKLREMSQRLDVSTDVTTLMREERDWLATRVP